MGIARCGAGLRVRDIAQRHLHMRYVYQFAADMSPRGQTPPILKRFVYINDPHPQARKIETEITFDLENLDIARLTTEGSTKPDKYDLVGSIQVT